MPITFGVRTWDGVSADGYVYTSNSDGITHNVLSVNSGVLTHESEINNGRGSIWMIEDGSYVITFEQIEDYSEKQKIITYLKDGDTLTQTQDHDIVPESDPYLLQPAINDEYIIFPAAFCDDDTEDGLYTYTVNPDRSFESVHFKEESGGGYDPGVLFRVGDVYIEAAWDGSEVRSLMLLEV